MEINSKDDIQCSAVLDLVKNVHFVAESYHST